MLLNVEDHINHIGVKLAENLFVFIISIFVPLDLNLYGKLFYNEIFMKGNIVKFWYSFELFLDMNIVFYDIYQKSLSGYKNTYFIDIFKKWYT